MNLRIESSKTVKPLYDGDPPATVQCIPLSMFDKISDNIHIAAIFALRPPNPSNFTAERALAKVLAEYREWAGRLVKDAKGNPLIHLNDKGARLIEARVDSVSLKDAMPFDVSHASKCLHPRKDGVEELLQIQLTRFACGSLVVGYTMHHRVADGHAASQFLVAWGLACRGADISGTRSHLHDRAMLFKPHDLYLPSIRFEHRGVEFASEEFIPCTDYSSEGSIVIHKARFSEDFLKRLKLKASMDSSRTYTTFESLVAHVWRAITIARGLGGSEVTNVKISINGRTRLSSCVPDNYFGNLILSAYPRSSVRDLVSNPLSYAAELVRAEVATVNDRYFRSFIDFANSNLVEKEGLVLVPEPPGRDMIRNVDVDSWLRFPLCDLDFGSGRPFYFMPSYAPIEGVVFLLPSLVADGSVEACIPLFEHNLPRFKRVCYALDYPDTKNYSYTYEWEEEGKVKEMARL